MNEQEKQAIRDRYEELMKRNAELEIWMKQVGLKK